MDEVFKALADPTRRSLLDELFREDGQTLSALEEQLLDDPLRRDEAPQAARGGRPRGHQAARPREAPLPEPGPDPARPRPVGQQVRRALGGALSGLKHELESPMEKVFEIYIRTTPERLWEAITDPEIRSKYNFGTRIRSDWTPGSHYRDDPRRRAGTLGEGRTSRSTRHAGWCRPWTRSGATT